MKESASEKIVKKQILEYLERLGIKAWNNPRGMGQLKHGGFIRYGGLDGASDILGYMPDGRILAIETKASDGKNKASAGQINFIEGIVAAGGVGLVAKNLEDVINVFGRRS